MISDLICGNSKEKHYDVSVILLTYEQTKEKILLTLASILDQKNVELQIIISDDGSSITYVNECIDFFDKYAFNDYKIACHDTNQGTVKNYYDAILIADGDYVKDFGPGDCFYSEKSLFLWLNDIKNKAIQLSFCDAIYYRWDEGNFKCIREVAHPQYPEVYLKGKLQQKKYYLLYNDIFLGATIFAKKALVMEYLQKIVGKVKYAEDNMYRLMILDGVKCGYFPKTAIYYEWGSGISTQKNAEFKKAIDADWNTASAYLCGCCKGSFIDKEIKYYYLQKGTKLSLEGKLFAYIACLSSRRFQKKKGTKKRLTANKDMTYLCQMWERIIELG